MRKRPGIKTLSDTQSGAAACRWLDGHNGAIYIGPRLAAWFSLHDLAHAACFQVTTPSPAGPVPCCATMQCFGTPYCITSAPDKGHKGRARTKSLFRVSVVFAIAQGKPANRFSRPTLTAPGQTDLTHDPHRVGPRGGHPCTCYTCSSHTASQNPFIPFAYLSSITHPPYIVRIVRIVRITHPPRSVGKICRPPVPLRVSQKIPAPKNLSPSWNGGLLDKLLTRELLLHHEPPTDIA